MNYNEFQSVVSKKLIQASRVEYYRNSSPINLSKRNFLKVGGVVAVGTLTLGAGPCGVSKEKAVRVAGLVIEITKEAIPLLNLLGGRDIAITIEVKVIPALEKLKDALADADIPDAGSMLENVRSALKIVADGLLQFPDSPRRTTILGILTSVNVMLLTIEAFVGSETTASVASKSSIRLEGVTSATKSNAQLIRAAFEASRP